MTCLLRADGVRTFGVANCKRIILRFKGVFFFFFSVPHVKQSYTIKTIPFAENQIIVTILERFGSHGRMILLKSYEDSGQAAIYVGVGPLNFRPIYPLYRKFVT
jgi:hypothetical protein